MATDPCLTDIHNYRVVTTSIVGGHILIQCRACKQVDDVWPVHLETLQKKYQDYLAKEKAEKDQTQLKDRLKKEIQKETTNNPKPKKSLWSKLLRKEN